MNRSIKWGLVGFGFAVVVAGGVVYWNEQGSSSDITRDPRKAGHLPQADTTTQNSPVSCETTFAVIGDYGMERDSTEDVADLVKSWQPDFVATVGDNNYPNGAQATIDKHIGQYYGEFIHPYQGEYGDGAEVNRFFPALGNHDWHTAGAEPYLEYFELPGNERYYTKALGSVRLFILDSSNTEPDGTSADSKQAMWLKEQLSASNAPWNVVLLHHPPYSSGANHGSYERLQWPFAKWGADAVFAGHDHIYERLDVNDITFVVIGISGHERYGIGSPLPQSRARFNRDFGAVRVTADRSMFELSFVTRDGEMIDTHTATQKRVPSCAPIPGS